MWSQDMQKQKLKVETKEPIVDSETYTLPGFMERSGMGRQAMASARRKGLRVIRIAGRAFVRGRDFNEFLGRLSGDVE